jgi:transcriptional regulator with XRE-family HTH domain
MGGKTMLSKRLKELRAIKDITQADLARLLGVTQQAVAKWENKKAEPDNNTLIKLADYFHVSTDYLLGHEPHKKSTLEYLPIVGNIIKMLATLSPKGREETASYVAYLADKEKKG